jgi:formylglycine-generating enzyme required for sulfatase activity
MAKETIRITLQPPLLKALELECSAERAIDYFELLGVQRGTVDSTIIDGQLKQRTRVLRQWQNSPKFGKDVIKLLPILHRSAKILSDPKRREAYRRELEMDEKGETVGATHRFRELARVALIGHEVSNADREQLQRFAQGNGLSADQVRRIVDEVRGEYASGRGPDAPAPAEAAGQAGADWEFRIAGEGVEAFLTMLAGLKASGNHLGLSNKKLLEEAMNYGLDVQQAQAIIKQHQSEWFKDVARMVAGDGAISEAQIRLLLPKAADFSLNEQEAYVILSDYSLSAVASDDLRSQFLLAEEMFTADDIGEIVEDSATAPRRRSFTERLFSNVRLPAGVGPILIAVLVALALTVAIATGYKTFMSRQGRPGPVAGVPPGAPPGGVDDPVTPDPRETETPTPTPTPEPAVTVPPLLPDPESGMLLLRPERPDDPPPFELRIGEVSCAQYSEYLKSVLETPPPGWPRDGNPPPGTDHFPVSNVSWNETRGFCLWLAERHGWPRDNVRLPTRKEFERATRGVTIRGHGNPQAADYWSVARLGANIGPVDVMTTKWDLIRLAGIGQVYDMVGNVAEWGEDQTGDKRLVLGGGFNDKRNDFNAMNPRWLTPDTRQPWIGFRYVHVPGP